MNELSWSDVRNDGIFTFFYSVLYCDVWVFANGIFDSVFEVNFVFLDWSVFNEAGTDDDKSSINAEKDQ